MRTSPFTPFLLMPVSKRNNLGFWVVLLNKLNVFLMLILNADLTLDGKVTRKS